MHSSNPDISVPEAVWWCTRGNLCSFVSHVYCGIYSGTL